MGSATLTSVDGFTRRRLLEPVGYIHRPKPRNATTPFRMSRPWRRDSDETASGKSGRFTGRAPGRRSDENMTVFNSSGISLQDLYVAEALIRAKLARGAIG